MIFRNGSPSPILCLFFAPSHVHLFLPPVVSRCPPELLTLSHPLSCLSLPSLCPFGRSSGLPSHSCYIVISLSLLFRSFCHLVPLFVPPVSLSCLFLLPPYFRAFLWILLVDFLGSRSPFSYTSGSYIDSLVGMYTSFGQHHFVLLDT